MVTRPSICYLVCLSIHRLQISVHPLVRSSGLEKMTVPHHCLPKPIPHRKSKLVSSCVLQKEISQVRTFLIQGKACVPVVGHHGPVVVHCIDTSLERTGQQNILSFLLENESFTLIFYPVILHTEKFPKPAHMYSAPIVCGERILTYRYTQLAINLCDHHSRYYGS